MSIKLVLVASGIVTSLITWVKIMDPNPIWNTRAVIVHRDDNGSYGLTLSGDNPVKVQTVKKGE